MLNLVRFLFLSSPGFSRITLFSRSSCFARGNNEKFGKDNEKIDSVGALCLQHQRHFFVSLQIHFRMQ